MPNKIQALLVNPPIYDFTAFDFWLRPYGMLRVAGYLRHTCDLTFFDYLIPKKRDSWGRGRFPDKEIPKPEAFSDIPRRFRRFGRPRRDFRDILRNRIFDVVLVQTMMTYWYLGVKEVMEDVREIQPKAKIVLGGVYATLCPQHANSLGADLVLQGKDLDPLWQLLGVPQSGGLPFWDQDHHQVGVIKLTEGCPYRCSYCSVPILYPEFTVRPLEDCLQEAQYLVGLGVRQVAFYDDALLFQAQKVLVPFLQGLQSRALKADFHTPNALNARLITPQLANLMVKSGFRSFYLGFESASESWQNLTGGKVYSQEFGRAVANLQAAGADAIISYIIIGHPNADEQEIESTMRYASELKTRILLSEFAPIPGTLDGERSREWVDMAEPLSHNKTAFAIRRLGLDQVKELKELCLQLNQTSNLHS
jgi:radical SAM superfamily enzyme YgiQ (UPF0313 family)